MILATVLEDTVNFFLRGGPFMVLLVLLSIVSLTVILLRGRALRERTVIPEGIAAAVEKLQPGDDLDNLQKAMADNPSPLAQILGTLINHLNWPKAENLEAIQTRARNEVSRLERGLVILEISTGVAPLLGLLGTLSGLVGIFAALGGSGDPVVVARGISEALNTTIVGLAVAAPSLIAHNYFQRKIEVMAVEMESLAADLLAKCYPHGELPQVEKHVFGEAK
ncbi:MAG: MotA/TolQ/ExbB proton channel family protein [Terrimicrobiaceae bacterium]|nr:MotA/TolQ/ExbB proton channel family protein [Terrimicrobiaceae bacterium]